MLDSRANSVEYQSQTELIKQLTKLIKARRNGHAQKRQWAKLVKAARYLDVLANKANFTTEVVDKLSYIYDCLISTLNLNRLPVSPGVALITTPTVSVGIPGPPGPAGASTYLYFAFADDENGTGFTTAYNITKVYMAFRQSPVPIMVVNAATFAGRWFKRLGEDGIDGEDGAPGTPGTDGEDGRTVLYGAANPSPTDGVNGDFWINTTTWTIFGPKASGTWPSGTGLIGPAGSPGEDGIDGATILSGSGVPTNLVGADGDFYIDLAAYDFYGPKAAGAWPAGISLIGPQGDPGTPGAPGGDGEDGAPGTNAFIYIAYADSATGIGYSLVQSNDSTATLDNFNQSKSWIGIVTSATAIGTTITPADFAGKWARYQGDGDRWTTFSVTELTIAVGNQTLTVEPDLSYSVGQSVVIADPGDFTNRMEGYVISYNPASGALVVSIAQVEGSGTFANWAVSLQAFATDPPTTYAGPSPSTVTVNDLPAGSVITGRTYDELFQHIYAPFVAPTFSSFLMQSQVTQVEVGTTISGSKTFTWATTNSPNVEPNSLVIRDVTNSTDLATGLANDGAEAGVAVGTVTKTSPGNHTWRIIGDYLSPNVGTFQRDFVVAWLWTRFSGTSANTSLTEAQIEALSSALATGFTGTYTFGTGNYKYMAWPDTFGSPAALTGFRDTSTNLAVAMADSTDDAAYSNTQNGWSYAIVSVTNGNGITTNYRVYRTKYPLGGSINIQVS